MKYRLSFILLNLFFILFWGCSHSPVKNFPSHSIAILNSNKNCMMNFFNKYNFSSDTTVIVTYFLEDKISNEEMNIYKDIYRLIHIYLSSQNIKVLKLPDFVNKAIDYQLLKDNNIDKILKFSIDNIGVRFDRQVDIERGPLGIRGNLERTAYTSIFFQIIDVNTNIVEFSNYIDGHFSDIIPRNQMKKLKSHDYVYYPQKINIYKDSDECDKSVESIMPDK